MKFAQPEFLYALPVVWLLLGAFAWWSSRRRKILLQQFSGEGAWTSPGFSSKRNWMNGCLNFLFASLLFLTLARPMYFDRDERSELQGAPYLIALDVSRSMLATDVKPSRYGAATNALDKFFAETRADRIGLITFSGVGYLNAPLTFDTIALRTILRYIDPNTLIDPGSSPAAAMDRAQRFFSSNSMPERVLILISDGEELEGKSVLLAAKLHRDQNMVIHTIGVGTATGSRMITARPLANGTNSGLEIVTKLDETNLRRIANAGGGKYFRLGENGQGLRQLREEVLKPLAEKDARKDWKNYRELFYAPLALGVLVFLLKLLLGADRFAQRRPLPNILESRA